MNRVVLVGGFWSNARMLRPVAEKIGAIEGVDDLEVYSFKDSMGKKSGEVKRASKDAKMVTHSAGMLAVEDARPSVLVAYNPPVPENIAKLVFNANRITFDHVIGAMSHSSQARNNQNFLLAAGLVVANPVSFYGNIKHLYAVTRFNALLQAASMQAMGTNVYLEFTDNDKFFDPTIAQESVATDVGVSIGHNPGLHNDFLVEPARLIAITGLAEILNK